MEKMGEVMPMPKVTDLTARELTPGARIKIIGISNVDTEDGGEQMIAVAIAEMYAWGHSATKHKLPWDAGLHGMG